MDIFVQTVIELVGMLNDDHRELWPLFRLIANVLGLTFFEDGSIG